MIALPSLQETAQTAAVKDTEKADMRNDSPVHDLLLSRLTRLVDEVVATGIARDVAVAVLIDLVTSPRFDTAAPDPMADSEPHPDYQRGPGSPVLVHGMVPGGARAIGTQDEADFLKPFGPFSPS